MSYRHGEIFVEAWQISKESERPQWVDEAFRTRQIFWDAINKDLLETVGGWGFPGLGTLGDYLVKFEDSYRIVDPKQFVKEFFPVKTK